jgi:5-methyltetrahydropteroyltriglutamate--homocysteine methyltransferase
LFRKIKAQRLLLEYDDSRAGSFEPLRDVDEDKFVVLGLITTKRPELESVEMLQRRIEEAGRVISLDRVGLSPQCGFASSILGNRISQEDQRRKLQRVVSAAQSVWG